MRRQLCPMTVNLIGRPGARGGAIEAAASTSSVPRAVASHVYRDACAWAAALMRARRSSSPRSRSSPARSVSVSGASTPVRPSTTASAWPAMSRRDRGRAARGRLGDRHAPALVRRRAREHPRPPVEVDHLVVVDVPGQADPALGARASWICALELLALVALAHDHRLERRGGVGFSATSASISTSNRFTGTSRPTRRRAASATSRRPA